MSAEEIKKVNDKFSACSTQNPGESRSKDKAREAKENSEKITPSVAKSDTTTPEAKTDSSK